jgi:molybdopterin synthase catalytic subunit
LNLNQRVHKKGEISLNDLIDKVKSVHEFEEAGALAIFIGVVRGKTETGKKVEKLEIEAYEEKADEVLGNICRDLKKKKGIVDVQIHHFLGKFDVGEELVYVLVAGMHRNDVFLVMEEAVERYKKEVPIFKKEYIIDEKGNKSAYWVSEKQESRS